MIKYVKGDVSIRDSFKKNVSQRGLGSNRPHGTRPGLNKCLQDVLELTSTIDLITPYRFARYWTKKKPASTTSYSEFPELIASTSLVSPKGVSKGGGGVRAYTQTHIHTCPQII